MTSSGNHAHNAGVRAGFIDRCGNCGLELVVLRLLARWARPGVMPEPKPGERVLGGHENLWCGYLEEYPEHLLSLNSWGVEWGLDGYFLMPIKFALGPNVSDLRTIVRAAP